MAIKKRGTWAILIWVVPTVVITALVAVNPSHRSVTPTYHRAAQNWADRAPLYGGFEYHYPPQFALIFAPFHDLPVPVGDILWRLCCCGLLAHGLWRLCQDCASDRADAETLFLWATLVSVPLSVAPLRNGQANALIAGLFAQGLSATIRQKWWHAVIWLMLSLAVKQFSVVFLLLAIVLYPKLRLRTVVGAAVCLLLPFFFANYSYVISQSSEAVRHLGACAVTQRRFADFAGIVHSLGWELPTLISLSIRLVAACATLAAWYLLGKPLNEPFRGLWLYALGTSYIMLFNPMTEANSYVILAIAMGCWSAVAISTKAYRRFGQIIAGMALSMGLLPNPLRPFFGNSFAQVWHPTMTLIFIIMVGCLVARRSRRPEGPGPTGQPLVAPSHGSSDGSNRSYVSEPAAGAAP